MAAQNKLGELFVDIGVGGLGKTLKGLNSVSASFLLTKNAAGQMVKPIADMTHKFGQTAMATKKLQLQFKDMSLDMTQRLKYLAKTQGLDSIFNSMEKLQQLYSDYAAGKPIDANMIQGLQRLGVSIDDYSSSFEDLLRMMEDIKTDALSMDYDVAKGIFDNFLQGLDLGQIRWADYLGTNFTNIPKMANALSEEEVRKAIDGEIALQQLQEKVFNSMAKIFIDHEQPIINMINKLSDFADKAPKFIEENLGTIKELFKLYLIGKTGEWLGGRAGAVAALGVYGGAKLIQSNIEKGITPGLVSGTTSPIPYVPTNKMMSWGEMERIQKMEVNVTNNIQSTDPYIAGNEAARRTQEVLNANRYNRNTSK